MQMSTTQRNAWMSCNQKCKRSLGCCACKADCRYTTTVKGSTVLTT